MESQWISPDIENRPALTVYLLGQVPVQEILSAQRRLVFELEESGDASLILCEHFPSITIGRSGSRAHILPDDEELRAEDMTPVWVGRGGGCWLHGPGQLAGYLIGHLNDLATSADEFLFKLETALLNVLMDFDISALPDANHTGLYVAEKRIAAIGVCVVRNMVHYGFILNVGPYLRIFDQLEEPAQNAYGVLRQTSMEALRVRPVSPARLRSRLTEEIRQIFQLQTGPIFSESNGHSPLPEVAKDYVSG